MYQLMVRSHFDAAHFLRGYQGKCSKCHGHRFHYSVGISGETLNDLGILIDFKDVKSILKDEIEEVLDHCLLNEDVPPFDRINPTAENIAKLIYDIVNQTTASYFSELLLDLDWVEVYESENCGIRYWEDR